LRRYTTVSRVLDVTQGGLSGPRCLSVTYGRGSDIVAVGGDKVGRCSLTLLNPS